MTAQDSPAPRHRRARPAFKLDGARMILFAALLVSSFLTSMVPEGATLGQTVADHPARHAPQQAGRR